MAFAAKVLLMKFARLNRINVTAPALVVLATVVNAVNAASPSAYDVSPENFAQPAATADLSWAVRGGATQEAQTTRVLLARKAASDIRSLDGIGAASMAVDIEPAVPLVVIAVSRVQVPALRHTSSTHQHSALLVTADTTEWVTKR